MRSRAWIVVINNYTFDDMVSLHRDLWYRYLVFGFEIGEKGTEHIQGYVYFDEAKTRDSIKKKLPRAHLEPARGTPEQNFDYCNKQGEYYEDGVKPEQGRAQWHKIKEAMINPKDNPHLFNQYRKTYREVANEEVKNRTEKTLIIAPHCKRYDYEGAYLTTQVGYDMYGTYDGEETIVTHSPDYETITNWYFGYPLRVKRGYEIIYVNPKVFVIIYDHATEYNKLIKIYKHIVDQVIPPNAKEV